MKRYSWISSCVRVYGCGKKSYEAGGCKAAKTAAMPAWMCKKPGTVTQLLQTLMCALHSSSQWLLRVPLHPLQWPCKDHQAQQFPQGCWMESAASCQGHGKTFVILTCMRLLTVVREVIQESIPCPTDWGIWLSWCLGFAGAPAAHSSELSHFPGRATTLTIPTLPSELELGRHCHI